MSIFQILAIGGMLSPILYTLLWILGSFLRDDYDQIKHDVSSLMATNAPRKRIFDSFIISSSVLLLLFYLGLHEGINGGQGSILGPVLFILSSIFPIICLFILIGIKS